MADGGGADAGTDPGPGRCASAAWMSVGPLRSAVRSRDVPPVPVDPVARDGANRVVVGGAGTAFSDAPRPELSRRGVPRVWCCRCVASRVSGAAGREPMCPAGVAAVERRIIRSWAGFTNLHELLDGRRKAGAAHGLLGALAQVAWGTSGRRHAAARADAGVAPGGTRLDDPCARRGRCRWRGADPYVPGEPGGVGGHARVLGCAQAVPGTGRSRRPSTGWWRRWPSAGGRR